METLFFILECDFFYWKRRQYKKNSIPYNYTQFFIIFAEDILRSAIWKQAFIALACDIFALNFRKCEGSANDTT